MKRPLGKDIIQGFGDFDFLVGEWRITNERLRARLKGSTDWEIFPATSKVEKVMPLPGTPLPPAAPQCSPTFDRAAGTIDSLREPVAHGTFGGNLDQMFIPAKGFTGMTLRLYDPATRLWSIYWSDTISYRLFPPTVGRFENGRGVFFGDDVGRRAGEGPFRLDGRRGAGLGTVDVGGWRGDVGEELGDAVWAVAPGTILFFSPAQVERRHSPSAERK